MLRKKLVLKISKGGNSLAVQWLRFQASHSGGCVLICGWGTKILHAARQKKKKKKLARDPNGQFT